MTTTTNRLGELDALRGLAALAVVFFHYTVVSTKHSAVAMPFQVNWGSYGVGLFFAISGYVILMTLERTKRPMDFVVSRFVRLYPAYWVAVALTFGVVAVWSLPGKSVTPGEALINLSMWQEMLRVPHVDGVYWSLQAELLFYVWTFALYCFGMLRHIRVIVGCWMLLSLGMAAAAFAVGMETPPYWVSKILMLRHSGLFTVGIIAYLAAKRSKPDRIDLALWVLAVCVTAAWDGPGAAVACALTIVIFWLFLLKRLTWLAWKPLCILGAMSYSLYLVHQNVGFIVLRELTAGGWSPLMALGAALSTSLMLSAAITYGVERPLMRAHRRSRVRRIPSERAIVEFVNS